MKGTDERYAKSLTFNDLLYDWILKVQFACNQRFRANGLYRYVLVSERQIRKDSRVGLKRMSAKPVRGGEAIKTHRKVIQNHRNYKNNHGKKLRYSP